MTDRSATTGKLARSRARQTLVFAAIGFCTTAQAGAPISDAPSQTAATVVAAVVASSDNDGLPFLIIDKVAARIFAFDARGGFQGSTVVLVGLARGDVSPPGIGSRPLAAITPADRITPAGRFEAVLGHNLARKDILWLDYDAALSLHRVVTTKASERRLERLQTPTLVDNRISYGCINVPTAFYEGIVLPLFKPANGTVYILPEEAPIGDPVVWLRARNSESPPANESLTGIPNKIAPEQSFKEPK